MAAARCWRSYRLPACSHQQGNRSTSIFHPGMCLPGLEWQCWSKHAPATIGMCSSLVSAWNPSNMRMIRHPAAFSPRGGASAGCSPATASPALPKIPATVVWWSCRNRGLGGQDTCTGAHVCMMADQPHALPPGLAAVVLVRSHNTGCRSSQLRLIIHLLCPRRPEADLSWNVIGTAVAAVNPSKAARTAVAQDAHTSGAKPAHSFTLPVGHVRSMTSTTPAAQLQSGTAASESPVGSKQDGTGFIWGEGGQQQW